MYLREKLIKILTIKNVLLFIIGWCLIFSSVSVLLSLVAYYSDDLETALHARATPECVRMLEIGVILLFICYVSKKFIEDARFFSSYFEGDLDGYITYAELGDILGKKPVSVMNYITFLKPIYMVGFELYSDGKNEIVLDSKKIKCLCKSCGAEIDKRQYFVGKCEYCGSSDLNAKVLTNNRFYYVASHVSEGKGHPGYYLHKRNRSKHIWSVVWAGVSGLFVFLNFIYCLSQIVNYNNKEYLHERLMSGNYPKSYELIHKEMREAFAFGAVFFVAFLVILIIMIRRISKLILSEGCARYFASSDDCYITSPELDGVVKGNNRFKAINKALKKGYLKNCSFEKRQGELKIALARQVVKDRCPNCGSPIVGAVEENYVCSYCNSEIMDVVVRQ